MGVPLHNPLFPPGIAYRRYQREHPNSPWHVDTETCTRLLPGMKVTLSLVEDDMSHYCVGAFLCLGKANSCSPWTLVQQRTRIRLEQVFRIAT